MSRVVLLLAAALLAAGCDGEDDDVATTTQPTEATKVAVYLVRDDEVAGVRRDVEAAPTVAARAALTELLDGPTAEERADGYGTAIADSVSLRDLELADGVATVDLSGLAAGTEPARLGAAQIVHTLTRLPGIVRVAMQEEGDAVGPPVDRSQFEEAAPAILIESPLPGDRVSSPLRISGTSNVFEATFQLEVLADDGSRLARRFVTATSGSGERGTFEVTVPVEQEGSARIVAWEDSAKDGSRINQVEVPITVEPSKG